MTYWVYENWRAHGHRATVHAAECRHCQDGQGVAGGTRVDNGRWHGQYQTLAEAKAVAVQLPGDTLYCQVCRPDSTG